MENYQIRSKVHPKQRVAVLLKEDYENGNLTYGTVDEILTKTDTHYRGIMELTRSLTTTLINENL